MAGSAQLVSAVTVREWARTHVEFHDEHCWGPPPAAVARLAVRLVDVLERAHELGQAPLGLDPDSVLVTDAGEVRLTAPAGFGSAADRAADLHGLGVLLFLLATGLDPGLVGDGSGPQAQHERVSRLLDQLSVGNPCAAGLAPIVLALLHPLPARRPPASALRMMLTGQPPRTGPTVQVRLAPR